MLAFATGSTSRYTAEPLLGGIDGTEQTIQRIRSLVDEAWRSLDVRRLAVDILRSSGAPQYDEWSQISAIYNWIRSHFYFVNDPVGKEVLMPFVDLIDLGAGDCDEINAIAMSVLLGAVGYEVRLVTVAADANDPTQFSHIYTEVFLNGNWIPMDAARPGAQIGQAPPSFFQREWWSLTDDAHGPYPGAGQLGQYARMKTEPPNRGALMGDSMGELGLDPSLFLLSLADDVAFAHAAHRARKGLGSYRGLGQIDTVDGSTVDLSNLPLPSPSDVGASLESLPPFIDTGGGSGSGILQSIESGLSFAGSAVKSVAAPIVNLVTGKAVGPGGQTHLAPSTGVVATSPTLGGISLNTLLVGGLILVGGIFAVRAMSKK